MKKLLTILSVISLTSAAASVVACGNNSITPSTNHIDLTTTIPKSLVLGKLNNNSIKGFFEKFQTKLLSLTGLSSITNNDYDVYKAGTTTAIQDSDITNSNHIFVDINSKGNQFVGLAKNIYIHYEWNENNINVFEVDYRALAHNWIKTKVSRDIFLDIKNFFNKIKIEKSKTNIFKLISNFYKIDNNGAGGSILQSDYDTFINVIVEHFQEINSFFEKLPENQGLLIVTNRIGSWDKKDDMGVFSQFSANKIDNSIITASIIGTGSAASAMAVMPASISTGTVEAIETVVTNSAISTTTETTSDIIAATLEKLTQAEAEGLMSESFLNTAVAEATTARIAAAEAANIAAENLALESFLASTATEISTASIATAEGTVVASAATEGVVLAAETTALALGITVGSLVVGVLVIGVAVYGCYLLSTII